VASSSRGSGVGWALTGLRRILSRGLF